MPVILQHRPQVDYALYPLTSTTTLGAWSGAVPRARAYVMDKLCSWDMLAHIENAPLVVSELVTNAIKASWPMHSACVTLWLWANGQNLLVEVWDASPEMPRPAVLPDEGGRGLTIVSALCQGWGYYPERVGKVVWAVL
jgi:hypothetical protein